jgi:hypothetical protein
VYFTPDEFKPVAPAGAQNAPGEIGDSEGVGLGDGVAVGVGVGLFGSTKVQIYLPELSALQINFDSFPTLVPEKIRPFASLGQTPPLTTIYA